MDLHVIGPLASPAERAAVDSVLGKLLARRSSVGIELVRSDVSAVRRIKSGEPTLVVRGLPSELVLFAYGRGAVADVQVEGDAEARSAFDHAQLGL